MKKVFGLYKEQDIEVCVSSDDFYAKGNDWQTNAITTWCFIEGFDTEQEALKHLEKLDPNNRFQTGTYKITPLYVV